MSESTFWNYLKNGMGDTWTAYRIENNVGKGTPDVWYSFGDRRSGWIELKRITHSPRGALNIRHFTKQQQRTLIKIDSCDRSWFFLKIEKEREYLLVPGRYADRINGSTVNEVLSNYTVNYWQSRIDFLSLSNTLRF